MNKFSYKQKILGALLSLAIMSFFGAMTSSQVWADTMILTPTQDTYIAWNQTVVSPTGDVNEQNYGSATGLGVGAYAYPTVPASWGWNYKYRSLVQFDLSSIPAGLNITSVSLVLTRSSYNANLVTADVIRMADDSWDAGTINWNTAPSAFTAATISGALDTVSIDYYLWTFDLSAWNMAEDLADGLVTFLLKDQNDQTFTPSRSMSFFSSELSSAAPQLVITYDSQVPIPGSFLLLGSGLLGLEAWRRFRTKPLI